MDVIDLATDCLIPYSFNNVKHPEEQINRIANSIKEFGFNVPLVVNKDNVVIAGHGRLEAAKKLGLKSVPVVMKDKLTPAQEKAYRILDNKLTRDSEWDFDNIQVEFDFLQEDGFDFAKWGLEDLIPKPPIEPVEDDDFQANPLDEITTIIKRGDLIELGDHRLFCGDSTSAEDVGQLLDGATPFIMVTDPPYGVEYDPEWRDEVSFAPNRARGKVANDERVNWTETYKLFPGFVAYVWHADRHAAEIVLNLHTAKFEIRTQLIWKKQQHSFGRGHYHWQHEPCWYAVRTGSSAKWCGDRSQSTIWEISNKREKDDSTQHSTQKPIECMARPIRNHGGKDDHVYDPFLGSGTTLIACEQLNRKCFGIEIEPKYCQVIIDRYKKLCEKNNKPFNCKINGETYSG